MELGFVFTNYNNADFTINAIESLQDIVNENYSIVVVDNNSETADKNKLLLIGRKFNNVKILYSENNVGYFKGLNIGINYLRNNFPSVNCIVVGNNDVLFPVNFYQQLIKNKELLSKFPVVSPDIITSDGFHQNPHVIEKISKIRELIYDLYHINYLLAKIIIKLAKVTKSYTSRGDEKQYKYAREIYQGYGACYILTPKFFELFDDLHSPTFLMYEEYFLSNQLSEKGFQIYYEPSISITHLMHASTDKLPGKLKWKFSKESHREYRKNVKII